MPLTSLHLQNFRNHQDLSLKFSPQTTLVLGPNGSGKTNILEAIYLLSTGKSFRADRQQEMISYSADLARVRGITDPSSLSFRPTPITIGGAEKSGKETFNRFQTRSLDSSAQGGFARDDNISSGKDSSISLHSNRNDPGDDPAGDSSSPSPRVMRGPLNDVEQTDQTQLEILITRGQLRGQPPFSSHERGQRIPPKKYLLNGVSKLKKNFIGHLPAVLFGPHDLRLIDGSPTRRRTFLDSLLIQTSWEYRRSLLAYEQGLRQRNKLLLSIKESLAKPHQLLFWDKLLIKNGQTISDARQQFIDFLNQFAPGTGELSHFHIDYLASPITSSRLSQYSDRELAAGSTLIGPHREDFVVRIANSSSRHSDPSFSPVIQSGATSSGEAKNPLQDQQPGSENHQSTSRNLHKYGSRGQQRLAVLWLKLAELSFIKKQTSDTPLLLLDDIFSELDHPHRSLVSQVISAQQTIITAADEHLVEGIEAKIIHL